MSASHASPGLPSTPPCGTLPHPGTFSPQANPLQGMPALYFQRTSAEERTRHRRKFAELQAHGDWWIEAIAAPQGWLFELVTTDWREPGLLDKLFEAILLCHQLPRGVAIRRVRVFTACTGQVVNLLELSDRYGMPLTEATAQALGKRLNGVRREERRVLETIRHLPVPTAIPLLRTAPRMICDPLEPHSLLEVRVARLSNRFTSVLLHFLARSELWLNIQLAEFTQGREGVYRFYVLDKHGAPLRDDRFLRYSLLRTMEAMNATLTRFNLYGARRSRTDRRERDGYTFYHSPPRPQELLETLARIRGLAEWSGAAKSLRGLLQQAWLTRADYDTLQAQAKLARRCAKMLSTWEHERPQALHLELCRAYFEAREQVERVVTPLLERLSESAAQQPLLDDTERLATLCHPLRTHGFALDRSYRLYRIASAPWPKEPGLAFEPFLLMARSGCTLHTELQQSLRDSLVHWDLAYQQRRVRWLGRSFLRVLDESVRQAHSAELLREMRRCGLLAHYLPGFARLQGLVHRSPTHTYTVDEHTFFVVEALEALGLLQRALPAGSAVRLREDYAQLRNEAGLKRFALKYAAELRMLRRVPYLREHPAVRGFFFVMDEARRNPLEELVELNLLEREADTCLNALDAIDVLRARLEPLIRCYVAHSAADKRVLSLAALLHDWCKPAVDHPQRGAEALYDWLATAGIALHTSAKALLRWLIAEHHTPYTLMRVSEAERKQHLQQQAVDSWNALVLLAFADRMAVRFELGGAEREAIQLSALLKEG